MVKGGLGMEGSSEVNGRGHVVMQTEVDTGQGVVAHRLDGQKIDNREYVEVKELNIEIFKGHSGD